MSTATFEFLSEEGTQIEYKIGDVYRDSKGTIVRKDHGDFWTVLEPGRGTTLQLRSIVSQQLNNPNQGNVTDQIDWDTLTNVTSQKMKDGITQRTAENEARIQALVDSIKDPKMAS